MEKLFAHEVVINEKDRTLSIHRIINGERQYFTTVKLPEDIYENEKNKYQELFKLLGENLFLDSPQGRSCLGISDDESYQ